MCKGPGVGRSVGGTKEGHWSRVKRKEREEGEEGEEAAARPCGASWALATGLGLLKVLGAALKGFV